MNQELAPEAPMPPGQGLAVTAEILYLTNLMLAPGVAFIALAWLWLSRGKAAPALARNHLRQTFFVSLWGAAILLVACTGFIAAFGLHSEWTWTYVVLYFTCVHSTLIIFGVLGLSKAMAGKAFRYPLIGPRDA
jgi:uncharacterized Tic20 family protein